MFLRSNKLEQLEFKLEKIIIWDLETCRKTYYILSEEKSYGTQRIFRLL